MYLLGPALSATILAILRIESHLIILDNRVTASTAEQPEKYRTSSKRRDHTYRQFIGRNDDACERIGKDKKRSSQ
jgi:TPP-dependent indolepyruvate ferredoxin oxidoreductase alpha subunit